MKIDMKKGIGGLLVALVFCAYVHVAAPALLAQVGTQGAILGTCKDASGAVVPGARVTVTNLATGVTLNGQTNAKGYFEIGALPRGYYSVSVFHNGFRPWILGRVELTVEERKALSPVLQVGDVAQKVSVGASTELIQTEQASISTVVEKTQIEEMPLLDRNVVGLAVLAPGMQFAYNPSGIDLTSTVVGMGNRNDQTSFKVDGVDVNSGLYEQGTAIPSPEDVSEFTLKTADFGAQYGRAPSQVIISTSSGTNQFHGDVYDFFQNDALNARNSFAATVPKYDRNQFGGAGGGPIIKDKTFFFLSYQGTRVRQQVIFNSPTVDPAMLQGDFSSVSKQLVDPVTKTPYPGNRVNPVTFSRASTFFSPYILKPNSPGDLFKALAPQPDNTDEWSARLDHNISSRQRIYARYWHLEDIVSAPQYTPQEVQATETLQQTGSLNYNFSVTTNTLLTLTLGGTSSSTGRTSTGVDGEIGQVNLTDEAGIQGFPTAGRAAFVGLPSVVFSGYTGFSEPFGDPYHLWWTSQDGTVTLNVVRSSHSLDFGFQYDNRTTLARHGSIGSRGYFIFNGQYTGNSFADYLLGYPATTFRNYPLDTFGMFRSPYTGLFVQDYWKVRPNVTLDLGVRWDRWLGKSFVRGAGSTFDVALGKAVAGETPQGKVDLTAQSVAPYLAAATAALWVPASQAGLPSGLYRANGYVSPRFGIAWRPQWISGLVLRGAFGTFASNFNGNTTASAIIGPPYWAYELQSFAPSQLQSWMTAYPSNPTFFPSPSIYAASPNTRSMRSLEWNLSVQKALPFKSALTLSYVGNHASGLIDLTSANTPPPGTYANLQAASPFPAFGAINLYQNNADATYNALQLRWERRFEQNLSFVLSYAYSKTMGLNGPDNLTDTVTPYAPAGYNYGRSPLDFTHILSVSAVWGLPFGAGARFGGNVRPTVNALVGGWQFVPLLTFSSGRPLTFDVPGATLGNGFDTRPNLVGNLQVRNSSAAMWFNPSALSAPPPLTFGNSGIGILDGPARTSLDVALMKNFRFSENRYVQFRLEAYNSTNIVNLGLPNTSIGQSTTGKILSAGPARQVQLALKLYF